MAVNQNNNLFRVSSFNCEGFNEQKQNFLKELITENDIVFVQEFWLIDSMLHKLQMLSDNCLSYAVSGVNPGEILRGRPYGGVAIMWSKRLKADVERLNINSKRICALSMKVADTNIVMTCVYLPCDNYSNVNASDELLCELSQLDALLADSIYQHIIIGGDFNTDLSRNNAQSRQIAQFMQRWGLRPGWQSNSAVPGPTYMFSENGPSSQIDHFMFSNELFERLSSVRVLDRPDTPSRHFSIKSELHLPIGFLNMNTRQFVSKVAWYKATLEQKNAYCDNLNLSLENVQMCNDCVTCSDLSCTLESHRKAIDQYCSKLIGSCILAERNSIPRTCPPKKHAIAGWSEVVEPLRQTSLFWHSIWVDCNRPEQGAVADVMRATRKNYHNEVKNCLKNQKMLKRRRLGELASKSGSRPLFDELKRLAGSNHSCANQIDGTQNDMEICNKFANKYKTLYNTFEDEDQNGIEEAISARVMLCEPECCEISTHEVAIAVRKLKADKHDSNGFYSNHLLNGDVNLYGKLAVLFSCMLRHGHTPSALLLATIVPIPKDTKGNLCDSENYRGIALGCAISKSFDNITLERYGGSYLATSCMQFAYKRHHSTTMCTTVMKEVINHYWNGDSSVFACFVDATKAFDLVSFSKLFHLLLQRGLPVPFLRVLYDTYKRQSLSATWNSVKSNYFSVKNGVRQGAILSAVLFTVYVDELLLRLKRQQVGCQIGGQYAGALAYADDVTLLCPTLSGLKTEKKYRKKNRKNAHAVSEVYVAGRQLEWVNSFRHLGAVVTPDLSDSTDIEQKRNHFIKQANYVIHSFSAAPALVKSKLVQTYATALYGCQAWRMDNKLLERVRTAWNIVQRKVWRLPWRAHSILLRAVSPNENLLYQVHSRSKKFILHMELSSNELVAKVASMAPSCPNSNLYANKRILERTEYPTITEMDRRIADQIKELNQCLDGELDCGLNSAEIKQILSVISTNIL